MAEVEKTQALTGGVVTFLDVLGWKGVYDRQKDALQRLTDLIEGLEDRAKPYRGAEDIDKTSIKSISDTIAIFTLCEEIEATSAIEIHGELCRWVIPQSIEFEIPVRGATSYGTFQVRESIFIGKAVDEAAAWHEQSDWIGVHLTPSAEYIFRRKATGSSWIEYRVPNKKPLAGKAHCVNWLSDWKDKEKGKENIKRKFRRLGPIVPEIAAKFSNTLEFIEFVWPKNASGEAMKPNG